MPPSRRTVEPDVDERLGAAFKAFAFRITNVLSEDDRLHSLALVLSVDVDEQRRKESVDRLRLILTRLVRNELGDDAPVAYMPMTFQQYPNCLVVPWKIDWEPLQIEARTGAFDGVFLPSTSAPRSLRLFVDEFAVMLRNAYKAGGGGGNVRLHCCAYIGSRPAHEITYDLAKAYVDGFEIQPLDDRIILSNQRHILTFETLISPRTFEEALAEPGAVGSDLKERVLACPELVGAVKRSLERTGSVLEGPHDYVGAEKLLKLCSLGVALAEVEILQAGIREQAQAAHRAGATWAEIATVAGTRTQSAHERWAKPSRDED